MYRPFKHSASFAEIHRGRNELMLLLLLSEIYHGMCVMICVVYVRRLGVPMFLLMKAREAIS